MSLKKCLAERPKLLVITGPTGSGKSSLSEALAKELADADLASELINIDSVQIYKGFDIGAAKPSNILSHHKLFSYVDPDEDYNAWMYCNAAKSIINSCFISGKVPIFVGGTGMYIESLLHGIDKEKKEKRDILYDALVIILWPSVPNLYEDINSRVPKMLSEGLIAEVRQLLQDGYADTRAMRSIGYKQVKSYLSGNISYEQMEDKIKQETRKFSKRQRTWFRNRPKKLSWTPCELNFDSNNIKVVDKNIGNIMMLLRDFACEDNRETKKIKYLFLDPRANS